MFHHSYISFKYSIIITLKLFYYFGEFLWPYEINPIVNMLLIFCPPLSLYLSGFCHLSTFKLFNNAVIVYAVSLKQFNL